MDAVATPPALARAREEFLTLVDEIRPELHRYCARLTGSVIEGEDVVQRRIRRSCAPRSPTSCRSPSHSGAP